MKNRFRIEKILLTAAAMISLCIFVSYVVHISEWIFIHASLPDDYEAVTAKIFDWEELDLSAEHSGQSDGTMFISSYKYSYRFTYEYTVDDTAYTLYHDTNYVDEGVSNNTEMIVYYQKDNPVNSYLFTMDGYTYLFDKNITFQHGYSEHVFETYVDVVYFILFLGSIALGIFVALRVHRIRNGTRKNLSHKSFKSLKLFLKMLLTF